MKPIKCPACNGAGEICPDTLGGMVMIKRITERLGLRAVTEVTGVSPATISRLERGGKVTADHFKAMAEWCGLSPEEAWPLLNKEVAG